MDLQGKKVIVFGGAGFIGYNLCNALWARGAEVTVFDRSVVPTRKDMRCIQGDFFDDEQLKRAVQGQDMLVHAICTINPGLSITDYMRGYEKDFVQSARLCDLAYQSGKRLLFLSSGGTVYAGKRTPLQEDDPKEPINHYGSLKLCVEDMMQAFIHAGADFRIARIANAYGPGQDYRKGVGFIDAAIKKALNHEPIEIWGDGSIVRDYIYIDDICHMLCDVLAYDGTDRIMNIGTGKGVSQHEIIEMLRQCLGDVDVRYLSARSIDRQNLVLDTARYEHHFAFRPRSIRCGLNAYMAWLQHCSSPNTM